MNRTAKPYIFVFEIKYHSGSNRYSVKRLDSDNDAKEYRRDMMMSTQIKSVKVYSTKEIY